MPEEVGGDLAGGGGNGRGSPGHPQRGPPRPEREAMAGGAPRPSARAAEGADTGGVFSQEAWGVSSEDDVIFFFYMKEAELRSWKRLKPPGKQGAGSGG